MILNQLWGLNVKEVPELLEIELPTLYIHGDISLHVVGSITSHFVTMASNEKSKKNGSKKNANKSGENGNESIDISEQSHVKDMTVNKKLDLLLEVVKGLDSKIQEQDVGLQKQEERVSIRDVSVLPSAHSSPKATKDLDPEKLPSFQELKGDSKIQAEVDKPLQAYHNASRTDLTGKSNTAIKSGRFRAGIAKIKQLISWPQDFCAVNVGNEFGAVGPGHVVLCFGTDR